MKQLINLEFDEQKTVQAAAFFLMLSNGKLEYMKLVKLLYNSDREALHRWSAPITFDTPYAMPHGMVPSTTLDLAKDKQPANSLWGEHIAKDGNWNNKLIKDPGISRLSEAEMELMKEMYKKYDGMNGTEMGEEHHQQDIFTEWVCPNGSSTCVGVEGVLKAQGLDVEDIDTIITGLEGKAILNMMV